MRRSRLGSVVFRRGKCYTRVCVWRDVPKEGARCELTSSVSADVQLSVV